LLRAFASNEFARIQDAAGIERAFDAAMEVADSGRDGLRPPRFFREADAVFAGDRAAHLDDLAEEIVERGFLTARDAGLGTAARSPSGGLPLATGGDPVEQMWIWAKNLAGRR